MTVWSQKTTQVLLLHFEFSDFQVCHEHELLPLLLLRLTFRLFEDVGEPALAAVLRKKLLNYRYRPLSVGTFILYIYSIVMPWFLNLRGMATPYHFRTLKCP